jgi:hypothetical protein
MYYQVATKLAVSSADQFSQAVGMEGANAAYVEFTVFAAGTGGTVGLQEGNDLENWADRADVASAGAAGYGTLRVGTISARYVRLRYRAPTSGTFIIAAGINTSAQ